MKDVRSQIHTTTQTTQLHSSRWYQAMTLRERLPFLQKQTSKTSEADAEAAKKATQLLKQWKSQPPFQKAEHLFAQRLEMDGLTEEDLRALLALSDEDFQTASSASPDWLAQLLDIFANQETASLPLQVIDDPQTDAIFQAIKPLVARGYGQLKTGIAELEQRYTDLPFNPQTIGLLFLPRLVDQMFTKLTRTLILELNVARVQGRLQGETPGERFLYFLRQLSEPGVMLQLLEEYTVLARQLVEIIERRVRCALELLERLCADWPEIREVFALPSEPGVISEVKEGAGDSHANGRTVTILIWSSGLKLVYKPRSLAVDGHFQELLTWLNAQGCEPDFRTFKLLNKEHYGWCEFVERQDCTSAEEVGRFYQRLGGYLALLYVLEATDFHAENILAAGEYPMLIDLESLLQPRFNPHPEVETYGSEMIAHSVLRPGLLPQRLWSTNGEEGIDVSGLAGSKGQLTPFLVSTLQGQGTDEMSIGKERTEVNLGDNQPTLCGQEIKILDYEQDIISGFRITYQLLLAHSDYLLQTVLPGFAQDEMRYLLRPTQSYVMIQVESSHPNVLRDGLARERLLDRLWIGLEYAPHLLKVIHAEHADLANDDIPKFTTHPASRDLITSQGEVIPGFFEISGLDLVRQCIEGLSMQDLEKQVWVIQASFASLTLNAHAPRRSRLNLAPSQTQVDRARLLQEAEAIGQRLLKLVMRQKDMVGWMNVNLVRGREWRPQLAEFDLYNGLPGISLFLAHLGTLTENESYTRLAREVLHTLKRLVLDYKEVWQWGGIGAFDGAGSLIYLLAHLGNIWHEPELYSEAEVIVGRLPELIARDEHFDVLNGAAGCIAALLSLYAASPSPQILQVARQCGEHLLAHTRPQDQGTGWSSSVEQVPLAGMGHGNAGIALNLLRLGAITQDERFHQTALAAIEYERSLLYEEKHNWPDLRDTSPEKARNQTKAERSYMMAWCHGAPGIGLARLAGLHYQNDVATRMEIDEAVQALIAEGFGRNHSLCHGDLGNLETLFMATRYLPDLYEHIKIEPILASLLDTMQTQGWQSGVPTAIETPGLMIGLAGTGYALLRFADPARVPGLLSLDPPANIQA